MTDSDSGLSNRAARFPVHLSGFDAVMWRIEADPVLRSPILVVGLLDREPDENGLTAAVSEAVEALPRLRQRLVSSPAGRPRWVDDPGFCLGYHVRRVRAPRAGDLRSVLQLAEPSVMETFDPARPLWQLTVVDGVEDHKAAFLLRFHHTITDGVGGVDLAMRLFDQSQMHGDRSVQMGEQQHGPSRATARRSDGAASAVADVVGAAAGVAVGCATALRQPVRTATSVAGAAASVARMLQPASGPRSPLFEKRGLDRHLAVLDVPLPGLRCAAHTAGATVNDALLAAVGGGLREYHRQLGSSARALRVTMPISVRREGDPPGGNRFVPARFVLPVDDPDPRVRARIAGTIARRWRSEPGLGLSGLVAGMMARVPGPLLARLFAGLLEQMDVDAVDVPGLPDTAIFADARIERMWAFAPPTGAALSVTLLSHLDVGCIGVACDRAAVTDPRLLVSCLQESFDEFLALADQPLEKASA